MTGKQVAALAVLLAAMVGLAACGGDGGGDGADTGGSATLEARAWEAAANGALVLDVRTPGEYNAGHIEGAVNMPHDQIKARIGELGPDKARAIVLYCHSGGRTRAAARTLRGAGFTNILDARRYDRLKAEWDRREP